MRTAYSFQFLYRLDEYRGSVATKIEVHDGTHYLTSGEINHARTTGRPTPIAATLADTEKLLLAHGMGVNDINRFFERKQIRLTGTTVPLNDLLSIGWDLTPYPVKYGVKDDAQRATLLAKAKRDGAHLDASNAILDDCIRSTNGLGLKGLINLFQTNAVPLHLYVDYSIFGFLKASEMIGVYNYLNGLLADRGPTRFITESKAGQKVDPILLDWANRTGGAAISRDRYDEYETDYDWILHGAESGNPRLHKFVCDGVNVGVPDFGLYGPIPSAF